jgi:hypothetical protein
VPACPEQHGVQTYPHPDLCDHFFKCTNGTVSLERCENGLLYDGKGSVHEHCNYNWAVDCGNRKADCKYVLCSVDRTDDRMRRGRTHSMICKFLIWYILKNPISVYTTPLRITRKIMQDQNEILVSADDGNFLAGRTNIAWWKIETLLHGSKCSDILMPRHRNAGQNRYIKMPVKSLCVY